MSDSPTIRLEVEQEATFDGDAISLARIPGSNQLFVGGTRGQIGFIDFDQETPTAASWAAHVSYVSGLALAGTQLISVGSDHRLILWDRDTHRPLRIIDDHPKWVRAVTVSTDQRWFATVCDDMVCRLWNADTGTLIRELRGHEPRTPYALTSKLYCCAFSPDDRRLATADQVGRIVIWDVESGERLIQLDAPLFFTHDTNGHGYGGIRGLAFSPDGKLIAACGNRAGDTSTIGGSAALIQAFDCQTGDPTHDLAIGGNFFYERIRFHPDGRWLLGVGGAGSEQKIAFFDVATKEAIHQEPSPMLVFDMALDERADRLFTAGRKDQKGHLIQWKLTTTNDGNEQPANDAPSA